MFTIRTVLHPTDLWESSSRALEAAAELARVYNASLVLLHVWQEPILIAGGAEPVPGIDTSDLRRESRQKLEALALPVSLPRVERRFVEGEPSAEILKAAHECAADLIVMGTHGRSGLERLLLGSVAEYVLRQAPCPVMTIKPAVESK